MNPIEKILKKQKAVVIDGALGTELERKGYELNDPIWSAKFLMQNPMAIAQVHQDYLEAGADCITTASYQASFEGFMKKGLSKQEAKELLKNSIELAKKTRDNFVQNNTNKSRVKPLVAASIGPYGAFLADGSEFRGNYKVSEQELIDFHKERMQTILETNPDLLALETLPSFKEAKALCELLKDFPNAHAWLTFSAKDEKHINDGTPIKECAQWLDKQKQIIAIGINCTAPQYIASLISQIKEVSTKPIIVYPNAGGSYDAITKTWNTKEEISSYKAKAELWYEKGATLIGGCCQTTPTDIEQIAKWVRED
ncbi:homocysteine S-methyltransferase [Sulfurospirillum arcachonense]|uniref:homocysteine S-methyltransferase n=1 Tax=Sulfurospirillum arcachonense TaxID=57666 RepID=UPI0004688599|nr:homocysteine S-methyltransferase [Sulfurospirillum arcachonense]